VEPIQRQQKSVVSFTYSSSMPYKFLVPDWKDKFDCGIRLSYKPTRLHRLAGRYDNLMPYIVDFFIPPVRDCNFRTIYGG
jgi:hypothetical protein